jgi:hypothetical protein
MAKLITETTFNISSKIDENKSCFVEGIFSTAEIKNRNGRIYKKRILEREVSKLKELMQEGSLIGELNHPTYPDLNPERAAILIKDLF